mmetsp:Transcript_115168/g.235427  ORF Transcript_115168/g.235427 Transcript_115168/m.235427 type:complete len:83 (-) Transcript_115168:27-275(-)
MRDASVLCGPVWIVLFYEERTRHECAIRVALDAIQTLTSMVEAREIFVERRAFTRECCYGSCEQKKEKNNNAGNGWIESSKK